MSGRRVVRAVVLSLVLWSVDDAVAQEPLDPVPLDLGTRVPGRMAMEPVSLAEHARGAEPMQPRVERRRTSRLLGSLHATTAIMQALDLHSTGRAFSAGASEANPLMAGIARHRGAFIATKAAVTTSTILAVHKIGKHHRVAAIVTAVAINSAYFLVVRHNYRVASRR